MFLSPDHIDGDRGTPFNNVLPAVNEEMSCYYRISSYFLPRVAFGEGLSQVERVKHQMEEAREEIDGEREGHDIRMEEHRTRLDALREKREKLDGKPDTTMSDWMKKDPLPDQGQNRRR